MFAVNAPGPCACPCGWDAGGDLRVWDWYDEMFPPIPRPPGCTLSVTEDMGPDDHTFCPECDQELDPELMQPRQEVTQ